MKHANWQLPELTALIAPSRIVRIPPADDVPLSPRVARLLDTPELQRLAQVSQLGLVRLVYPGASHSRLEHSLGVYRHALLVLVRLAQDPVVLELIDPGKASSLVLAALLHDVGHWPFCHPIEDLELPGVPAHEQRAHDLITSGNLAKHIAGDWPCSGQDVWRLLAEETTDPAEQLLQSIISGPIDIDKLDYLQRDSLHAGVPYGRNFDAARLLANLTVSGSPPRLAVGEKARTAAEMLVFSRYVMFSEVYWHHAVRSATAMLQRVVFELHERLDWNRMWNMSDAAWIGALQAAASGSAVCQLIDGLFGPTRQLYKRLAQFTPASDTAIHAQLARQPYAVLYRVSQCLAERIGRAVGRAVGSEEILIDAPPPKREVEVDIDLVSANGRATPLTQASPVVEALARRQFDDVVKRVRVFGSPTVRRDLGGELPIDWLWQAISDAGLGTSQCEVLE
jgi:HD superfamily phosphohydrolase